MARQHAEPWVVSSACHHPSSWRSAHTGSSFFVAALCAVAVCLAVPALPLQADTVLAPGHLYVPRPNPPVVNNYSDRSFLVRLAPGADRQQFAARVRRDLGVRPQFYERFEGYASVHLPVSRYATGQRADPLAVLQSMPGVQSARPHLIMRSHATPNDPYFKDYGDPDMDPDLMDNQYYLFEVNAPEAWDLE
ncbi:MAG: hypothetical protein AB7Y46_18445, partial [Armatimonadota bacterium]